MVLKRPDFIGTGARIFLKIVFRIHTGFARICQLRPAAGCDQATDHKSILADCSSDHGILFLLNHRKNTTYAQRNREIFKHAGGLKNNIPECCRFIFDLICTGASSWIVVGVLWTFYHAIKLIFAGFYSILEIAPRTCSNLFRNIISIVIKTAIIKKYTRFSYNHY